MPVAPTVLIAPAWFMFAVGQIVSLTMSKIMQPKTPAYQGLSINIIESAMATAVIYGTAKIGGVVFYQETPGYPKTQLYRLIGVCAHEVEEFLSFHIDDEQLVLNGSGTVTSGKYNDKLKIVTHNGADDQAYDEDLVVKSDNLWSNLHRAYGVAYIYATMGFDLNIYSGGPPDILTVVKGKKIYDPRTGLTAYSSNSALCLRDYLLASRVAEADELDDTSFAAAANICDEAVALAAGGTETRYSCDGFFTTDQKPMDVLNEIVLSMAGSLWYSQGKWICKAGAYINPVLSLDEDDARGALKIVTRFSRRDLFNRVTGIFRGEQSNWQPDNYPPVTSQTFLTDDNNQLSEIEINLGFTSTPSRAQRIAKVLLYRQREQMVVSGDFGLRAAQLTPGDTVQLTNVRLGFAAKTFEVIEWGFSVGEDGDIFVPMTLQEISAGVYDWNADETAFETNNTNLLSPDFVPPVGVSLSEEERLINENLVNILIATVTASADENLNIDRVEVQFRADGTTQWRAMGVGELVTTGTQAIGVFEVLNVELGSYDVRARAFNGLGISGDWILQSGLIEGNGSQPNNIAGFNASVAGGSIHFAWDASDDLALSHYVMRHSHDQSGAEFGNAKTWASKIPRPGTSVTLPVLHGTYMLKTYSKNGLASSGYASAVIPDEDVLTYATVAELAQEPTFAGTKTGCSVASSRLVITDTTAAPSVATYEFSAAIDITTARLAHVHIHVDTVRDAGSGAAFWDGISGNWDTWPGTWDTWTSALQLADTDVVSYVMTTPDDPASGSAVWSGWRQFKAGDFYGRGFKFKVELRSTSVAVTPSIGLLEAFVGY